MILLNHCLANVSAQFKNEKLFFQSKAFQNFQEIWNNCSVRFSVDGGTNILYDFQNSITQNQHIEKNLVDPDFISGDFDSIRCDVLDYFKQHNVKIVHTPDQNYTDFTKCLNILKDWIINGHANQLDSIIVFYTSFDRIDQYLSILSTVHQISSDKIVPPILLLDVNRSISFVLNKVCYLFGYFNLIIKKKIIFKGFHRIPTFTQSKWVSLMPLRGRTTLTTTGLRWNLNGETLEFGKLVSSSNEFDPNFNVVTVEVDEQILFSIDYRY